METELIDEVEQTISDPEQTVLTNDDYKPAKYSAIFDESDGNDYADGIKITHDSNTKCTDDENYSFVTNILCDDSITGEGNAVVESVIYDESAITGVASDSPCVVTLTLKHDRGCPVLDAYRVKLFIQDHDWILGIASLGLGFFFGIFGLRYLRPISGTLIGIFTFCLFLFLSALFGFFSTVLGIVLTLTVATIAAVLLGILTIYVVWLAIGLLGILGGFFLGSLIYELTIMQYDFSHAWGFMSLTIFFIILGIILSCKYGRQVILFSTALMGAYFVMRGTCFFFPNRFPTEREIVNAIRYDEKDFETDWRFWVYASELILFFFAFSTI